MVKHSNQGVLFAEDTRDRGATVHINERCRLRMQDGFKVITFSGIPLYHYTDGDRMAEAHAMISLVEQGLRAR